MIYINHSFHNGFFHRVFDGSTAPRMRAQYPHLSHEYDHGVPRELPRELPWGHYTVFGSSPGLPGKPTKATPLERPLRVHVFSRIAGGTSTSVPNCVVLQCCAQTPLK